MVTVLVQGILSAMTQPAVHCVILTLVKVVFGQGWRVSYPQHSVCALEGTSVNISCSYSYPATLTEQEVLVQWMTIHRYQDHIHVTCRDQTRTCTLYIHPVKYSDARDYYCKITVNGAVKWIGQPGVKFVTTDLNVLAPNAVREGDSMTLTCNTKCRLSGSPSFIWSKDGHPVEKKQIIHNQLQLHPVSREDEGSYTCAVRGHEDLPSPPMRMTVKYPPKNTKIASDHPGEITDGSRVTLTCMSEANPPVHTYTWIKKSGAVELKSGEEKTLTFSKIRSEDSGEYLCRAASEIGQQDSPAVSILVLYSPKNIRIVSDSSDDHITEGSRVTLTCMSDADPPVHIYTWIKKSGAAEMKTGEEKTLTFSKIQSEDSGEYLCRAANRIGQRDSPAVIIQVVYHPKNTTVFSSHSGVITQGTLVTLTCSSDANPPAENYTWYKNGADTPRIGSGQSLNITNITSEDGGQYYCEARNEIGAQISTPVSVTVEGEQRPLVTAVNKYESQTSTAVSVTVEGEQRPLVTAVNKYESQTSTAVSVTFEVTGEQSPLRTAATAVVAGVSASIAVALLLGLICVAVWMRYHSKGKQKKRVDVQYSCIDSQGPALSNAADPLSAEAVAGGEDYDQYDTVIFTGVHFHRDVDTQSTPLQPEEEPLVTHASAQHTA